MATSKDESLRGPVWPRVREALLITASLVVALAVAGVTGWGSWGHIVHIGRLVEEPSADWLPVAIDGMMVNGTILVAVDRFRGMAPRPWAVISLWVGSVLTLAFNLASAWERGILAMLVAMMFATALLVTVEAMFHPSRTTLEQVAQRRAERRAARSKTTPDPAPVAEVATVPVPAPETTAPPAKKPAPRRRTRAKQGHTASKLGPVAVATEPAKAETQEVEPVAVEA